MQSNSVDRGSKDVEVSSDVWTASPTSVELLWGAAMDDPLSFSHPLMQDRYRDQWFKRGIWQEERKARTAVYIKGKSEQPVFLDPRCYTRWCSMLGSMPDFADSATASAEHTHNLMIFLQHQYWGIFSCGICCQFRASDDEQSHSIAPCASLHSRASKDNGRKAILLSASLHGRQPTENIAVLRAVELATPVQFIKVALQTCCRRWSSPDQLGKWWRPLR